MTFFEFKFLVFTQIGIDLAIVFFIIILIRKLRPLDNGKSLRDGTKIFESLLIDADKVSVQLRKELEEKHRIINVLNEKLDNRVMSLNVLLNRADALLSSYGKGSVDSNNKPLTLKDQEKEILRLAKEGLSFTKIAQILAIPKGEVKLVLDLKKKFSLIGNNEGVS
jgi:ATP/maltotriose-dependent transcriptional regulator MalT